MKALLVAMASDRVPPDIRVEETHGTLPLWNEARFSRVRQYEGRGLVGEKYLLQNISDAPMVLAEPEFDREAGQRRRYRRRAPQPAPRREHQRLRDPPRRDAMITPRQWMQTLRGLPQRLLQHLSPRQRQYAMLGALLAGGVGLLWSIFAFTASSPPASGAQPAAGPASSVTNIGVMSPGAQVNPVDQWVGTAGRKLAQYENEREEQGRLNKDRQTFEAKDDAALCRTGTATDFDPAGRRDAPAVDATPDHAAGGEPAPSAAAVQGLARRSNAERHARRPAGAESAYCANASDHPDSRGRALPARQAPERKQSAPPGLDRKRCPDRIHLPARQFYPWHAAGRPGCTDRRSIPIQSAPGPDPSFRQLLPAQPLPRRIPGVLRGGRRLWRHQFRARLPAHRESVLCAHRRRDAGSQDSGLDLRRGWQGRHARAAGHQAGPDARQRLLAGVVSGIGQGLATSSTEYSTSALGTVASATGAEAYRAGLGSGVGKALDRLAQYYIKLAENTFPVIEVDAGREVDVVITKGVRIDVPMTSGEPVFRPLRQFP
jgi:conjugal transfer pilus assembly protein TraB